MLGFELDFWDYATFATAFLAGVAGVLTYIWIAGLPGRIALARKHPEAEAVKLMGWAGLLPTVLPWIQALHLGVQADRHRRRPALPARGGQGHRRRDGASEGGPTLPTAEHGKATAVAPRLAKPPPPPSPAPGGATG